MKFKKITLTVEQKKALIDTTRAEGYNLLPWHDVDLTLANPRNSTRLVSPIFWPELTQIQFYDPQDGEVMGYISTTEANAILTARGLDTIKEAK